MVVVVLGGSARARKLVESRWWSVVLGGIRAEFVDCCKRHSGLPRLPV